MFTQRKMFSSSLVISAARVERDRHHGVDEALVERDRVLGALGRHAADDLGGVLRLVDRVARIDTLRREGEEESLLRP